jgi:xanthosine utilization system XapX-like protein
MRSISLFLGMIVFVFLAAAHARQPAPEVVATIGGEDVYQLLPVGTIPAIDDPEFVSGTDADR